MERNRREMEERQRAERKFMKDRANFINDHYKQHNFTSLGNVDMYGASQPSSFQGGNRGQGSYNQGSASYGQPRPSQPQGGVSFNKTHESSLNTSSNQLLFTGPSEARPAVVSSSSCCCTVM